MEKAVPFSTGYRFKVKQQKYLALHYELTINNSIEDCQTINTLLFSLCAATILYIIYEILYTNYSFILGLIQLLGIASSGYGIFVYFKCKAGYKSLKRKVLKINSILFSVFLGLHYLFIVLQVFQVFFEENLETFSVYTFVLGLLGFLVYFLLVVYYLIVNFDLCVMVKELHSLN